MVPVKQIIHQRSCCWADFVGLPRGQRFVEVEMVSPGMEDRRAEMRGRAPHRGPRAGIHLQPVPRSSFCRTQTRHYFCRIVGWAGTDSCGPPWCTTVRPGCPHGHGPRTPVTASGALARTTHHEPRTVAFHYKHFSSSKLPLSPYDASFRNGFSKYHTTYIQYLVI